MGRKMKEVFFAGAAIQKSYVSFHYMPIYLVSGIANSIDPSLMKKLKTKSCFHISTLTPELETAIREALELGCALYKDQGWITEI